MFGKDEEVELPELNQIFEKCMTGESKRPLWPHPQRHSKSASSPYEEEEEEEESMYGGQLRNRRQSTVYIRTSLKTDNFKHIL